MARMVKTTKARWSKPFRASPLTPQPCERSRDSWRREPLTASGLWEPPSPTTYPVADSFQTEVPAGAIVGLGLG